MNYITDAKAFKAACDSITKRGARITPERASASRARFSEASRKASRLRKQRGAA